MNGWKRVVVGCVCAAFLLAAAACSNTPKEEAASEGQAQQVDASALPASAEDATPTPSGQEGKGPEGQAAQQPDDKAPASATPTPGQNVSADAPAAAQTGSTGSAVQTPPPAQNPVQEAPAAQAERVCTLSVSCGTILNNLGNLNPDKRDLVPSDGVLLAPVQVEFNEGETVFNLLRREMKQRRIHFEFTTTPLYNSSYVEGIGNLYEFDCGEVSGWTYKVNGVFPNVGCSQYQLQSGDVVEWVYTCDLGRDVGIAYSGGFMN